MRVSLSVLGHRWVPKEQDTSKDTHSVVKIVAAGNKYVQAIILIRLKITIKGLKIRIRIRIRIRKCLTLPLISLVPLLILQ